MEGYRFSFPMFVYLIYTLFLWNVSQSKQLETLKCNFTKDLCDWTTSNSLWKVGDYGSRKFGLPSYPITKGRYIYMNSQGKDSLISNPLDPDVGNFCLEIYYYLFGINVGQLTLNQGYVENDKENITWTDILSYHGSNSDAWYSRKISIKPNGKKPLILKFDADSEGIALGPINSNPGFCEPTLDCDFEDFSSCAWSIIGDEQIQFAWTISDSSESHGKFAQIDTNNYTSSGKYLRTPDLTIKGSASTSLLSQDSFSPYTILCLSFSLYKPDETRDRIRVSLLLNNGTLIPTWSSNSIESSLKDPWRHASFTVSSRYEFKLIISADKYPSVEDTCTAIDDLKIQFNSCPMLGHCDFETGLCNYKTLGPLLRGQGRVPDPEIFGEFFDPSSSDNSDNVYTYIYTFPTQKLVDYQLISPVFPKTAGACLQFSSYFAFGQSTDGSVEILLVPHESNVHKVYKLTEKTSDELKENSYKWHDSQVSITSETSFSINIAVHGRLMFWAIDNLKYTKTGACKSSAASMKNTGSIEIYDNFNPLNSSIWSLVEWSQKNTSLTNFPSKDATNNPNGGYLYIESKGPVKSAKLKSIAIKASEVYCVSFFYWCSYSGLIRRISIALSNDNQNEFIKKINCDGKDENWHLDQATFTQDKDFQLSIFGESRESKLALDEVKLETGSCLSIPKDQIVCNFENDANCPIVIEPSAHNLWKVVQGSDLTFQTDDVTLGSKDGHVITLDFPIAPKVSDTSYFYLPSTKTLGPHCLTFSYKISCDCKLVVGRAYNIHSFDDYAANIPFNLGQNWYTKRAQISYTESEFYGTSKVIFAATYKPDTYGSIAIDDIEIIPGECESEHFCDFEVNCFWKTLPSGELIYVDRPKSTLEITAEWFIGKSTSSYSRDYYPRNDNTLDSSEGHFAAINIFNGFAALASQPIFISKGLSFVCLKFAYALPYNKLHGDSRIDIYSHFLNGSISLIHQITANESITSPTWTPATINIQLEKFNQDNMMFLYLVGANSGPKSIDDILVKMGPCHNNKMFKCDSGMQIIQNLVCDGVKNCNDGSDEKNCGNCSFSKDLCNYSVQNTSIAWSLKGNSIGVTWNEFSTQNSVLVSPEIQFSAPSCKVQFDFIKETGTQLMVRLIMEDQPDIEIWQSDVYDSSETETWKTASALIGRLSHRFRISFVAQVWFMDTQESLQLRNVNITHCNYENDLITDKSNVFVCKNGIKLMGDKTCDGNYDCQYGEDETNCDYIMYTFESQSDSGFFNSKETPGNPGWKITTGYGSIKTEPSRDHTTSLSTGHYIVLSNSQVNNPVSATLTGPQLMSTDNCSVSFYLSMPSRLFSLSIAAKNSNEFLKLATISNPTAIQEFKKFRAQIDANLITPPFTISFIGEQQSWSNETRKYLKYPQYIALDDIFYDKSCFEKILPECSSDQWTCQEDSSCIPGEQRCDGNLNCPKGSDEKNCGSCDFEDGNLCGWTNIAQNNKFITVSANQIQDSEFPKVDGAGKFQGKFLIIPNVNKNGRAVLKSPPLGHSFSECEFRFIYFFAQTTDDLIVRLFLNNDKIGNASSKIVDFLYARQTKGNWQESVIPLGQLEHGYYLQFVVDLPKMAPIYYPFALDNFEMINCFANDESGDFNISCTFQGNLCSWFQTGPMNSNDLTWKITNDQSEIGTWHTDSKNNSNFFVYVLRTKITNSSESAILMTPWHSAIGESCLTITYRMFCRFSCSFELFMETEENIIHPLLRKVDSQSNGWIESQVNLNVPSRFRLMITATIIPDKIDSETKNIEDFVIAIKSIEFHENSTCLQNDICDFEINTCDWRVSGWKRVKAADVRVKNDHTLGLDSGYVLAISDSTNSSLIAEHVKLNTSSSDRCLTFWSLPLPSKSDILQISFLTNDDRRLFLKEYRRESDEIDNNAWIYRRINIPASFWRIIFGYPIFEITLDKNSNETFALDDVDYFEGKCQDQGNCDFERSFCGWFNTGAVKWLRNTGSTPSPYSGPDTDASGSDSGWYVFADEQDLSSGFAALESEPLDLRGKGCLKFDYHMYTNQSLGSANIGAIYIAIKDLTSSVKKLIENIYASSSLNWQHHETQIPDHPGKFRIVLTAAGGYEVYGDIALDNILISQSECSKSGGETTIRPATTTERSTISTAKTTKTTTENPTTHRVSTTQKTTSVTKIVPTPSLPSVTPQITPSQSKSTKIKKRFPIEGLSMFIIFGVICCIVIAIFIRKITKRAEQLVLLRNIEPIAVDDVPMSTF